jgi:hypothetical protein
VLSTPANTRSAPCRARSNAWRPLAKRRPDRQRRALRACCRLHAERAQDHPYVV